MEELSIRSIVSDRDIDYLATGIFQSVAVVSQRHCIDGQKKSGLPAWKELISGEVKTRADARLDVCPGKAAGNLVGRLPASAVSRDEDIRRDTCQFVERGFDDGLEDPAGKVHPPDEGVNMLDASDMLRVAHDIYGTGMTAAREHDQPTIPDVDDSRLVVPNPNVWLPAAVRLSVVDREPAFEGGVTLDLSCDENHVVDQ